MTGLFATTAALVRAGRVYSTTAGPGDTYTRRDAHPLQSLLDEIEGTILPSEITCDLGPDGCIGLEVQNQSIQRIHEVPSGLSRGSDALSDRTLSRTDTEEVCAALQRWLSQAQSCKMSVLPIGSDAAPGHGGVPIAHLRDGIDLGRAAPETNQAADPFGQLCNDKDNGTIVQIDLNAEAPSFPEAKSAFEQHLFDWAGSALDHMLDEGCLLSGTMSTGGCAIFSRSDMSSDRLVIAIDRGIARIGRTHPKA